MYIVVAGNIGSGKSLLCQLLQERLNWEIANDKSSQNPYFIDFCHNMYRWAYNAQLWFLIDHFRQTQRIIWNPNIIVQSRSIVEDATIFTYTLFSMGLISRRDYDTYMQLYNSMRNSVPVPDLLIYLRASVPMLQKRLENSTDSWEQAIDVKYLTCLNECYEAWVKDYKGEIMEVNVDSTDYFSNTTNCDQLLENIKREVNDISMFIK
ncbi:MAG: deoxynucleoside kinase [Marinilabiliaceae bacterium]|mgnify:FL=1|nr:deoxynucleoside kinase [Marinilabiliaceae bacterium]